MSRRICLIIFSVAFAVLLLTGDASARTFYSRLRRSIDDDASKVKHCYKTTPCAWEIYTPFTRHVVDYMPNICVCPPTTECTNSFDDISSSAFVYLCKTKKVTRDSKSMS